jgi:CRISPR/Cas system-associated protein Cas10 (large subunit of type III CRISPR-Cas system)
MQKRCEQCGCTIELDDWYSFIRTKYCDACRKDVKRRQAADRMRELRRKTSERNELTRELCKLQAEENARLRELVQMQREQLRELKGV